MNRQRSDFGDNDGGHVLGNVPTIRFLWRCWRAEAQLFLWLVNYYGCEFEWMSALIEVAACRIREFVVCWICFASYFSTCCLLCKCLSYPSLQLMFYRISTRIHVHGQRCWVVESDTSDIFVQSLVCISTSCEIGSCLWPRSGVEVLLALFWKSGGTDWWSGHVKNPWSIVRCQMKVFNSWCFDFI